jgi:hypothetical protein
MVLTQARELPTRAFFGNAMVVTLQGLGWTDYKMSPLNRLNSTGTTN